VLKSCWPANKGELRAHDVKKAGVEHCAPDFAVPKLDETFDRMDETAQDGSRRTCVRRDATPGPRIGWNVKRFLGQRLVFMAGGPLRPSIAETCETLTFNGNRLHHYGRTST